MRLLTPLGLLGAFLLAALGAGCRGQTSREAPVGWIRNMHNQPRYNAQAGSRYFRDGRAMRTPVAHTVPVEAEPDTTIDTGVQADGTWLMTIPRPVVEQYGASMRERLGLEESTPPLEALARRGRSRFDIYCVPCHGGLGDGRGMVPRVSGEAAMRPPSFHDDRIRTMPDGQLYATIRNGLRNMPAYRAQIPVRDRWAIVAYVRALQLQQMDRRTARVDR